MPERPNPLKTRRCKEKTSPFEAGFSRVVPEAGIEPARCFAPADFESAASTNFATPARV
jgi:hypothetical protein